MPYGQTRIPIGRRREKVTIQQAVTASDGMGGQTVTKWKTVSEPWAKIEALDERQQEGLMGEQLKAKHGYLISIPYQSGLTADLRMIVRDTTMQIHTIVDDLGTRKRLVLQVRETQI